MITLSTGDDMTTNELHTKTADKLAYLRIHPLRVLVQILDSREVWGRVDCLVSPIHGSGEQWVSLDRLDVRGANHENG